MLRVLVVEHGTGAGPRSSDGSRTPNRERFREIGVLDGYKHLL